jgi:L-lactate dehydrogenase complex protein LldG
MLGRIRAALGSAASAGAPEPPPVRIRVPEVNLEDRIESFSLALEKLNGKVFIARTTDDARAFIESQVAGKAWVTSHSLVLRDLSLEHAPALEQHRDACAAADIGITSAGYGLADTGTLVVFASEEERLVSLLPPVHICVLPRERLLTGLDELLVNVPLPADRSSSMVLITGPSRTADIEQILVRGVHGPAELLVVIV